MKCPGCSYNNLETSVFCQECGYKLHPHTEAKEKRSEKSRPSSIYKELEQDIEDVLFVPKKKRSRLRVFLIIALLIVIGFVVLVIIGSTTEDTTPSVSSNNQLEDSLATFPIYNLVIENPKLDWVGQQLYFRGTIKNNYSKAAKDIRVRLDLYWDKALKQLFDTRFLTIIGASPNGAFTFELPVYAFPEKAFWWIHQIESASF